MFCLARVLYIPSSPALRMLSPQQTSSEPAIPKSTPAFWSMRTVATADCFVLLS